ncbi:MAG TPA: adenylate/guanylate cyclase domain-containing protein, partial [Actinomycetota bacterium]
MGDHTSAAPAGEERKLVTVLFADVTGSTTLGEQLDPERLRDVLATYFEAMRTEIEAEGGTVEKFIGDAVMAVFGVPQAHEDDAGRALRAARRMFTRLETVNEELRRVHDVELGIRIGVHTGDVLAAIDVVPGEPMVTGDVVNTAARLQTAAQPGQIVASARTVRSAPGSRWRALPDLTLKGKADPVEAVIVLGGPEGPSRGIAGLSAPLVGRDGEMNLLRSTFERVRAEERPHLATIYGDPGVGKSRLVREFLDAVSTGDVTVVQGRCLPYGDGIAYWPLAEILKERSGIDDRDPPNVVIGKVRSRSGVAGAKGVDIDRTCAALAFTIGVEDPAGTMAQRDPRQVRSDIHAAWQTFFSALAAEQPLVAVVDDIHWADPSLLDLVESIADRAEGPILLVCPTRPNLADRRPTWGGGRRNASSIALDPLTSEQSSELMALLLDVDDLPDRTRASVLERAEGNPFFLEEIVRHLIDEGAIEEVGGRWTARSSLASIAIPDTVQGVLAARIDLLERDDRRALEYAAVVGRVFWQPPVARLLNGSGDRLSEMLDRLQDRDLVRSRVGSAISGETEFIFKHVLTRDVAYERLPRADRARAHATVAEWIETTAAGRADFAELLCYHFEEAYRAARDDPRSDPTRLEELRIQAFEALLAAAGTARMRFSIANAVSLVDRAEETADGALEHARVLEERG